MHLSSLPSPHGVGTMGAAARAFVDFLQRQRGSAAGSCCPSAPPVTVTHPTSLFTFAGNPYLIELDALAEDGLLEPDEYERHAWESTPELRVNYGDTVPTALGGAAQRL